VVNCVTAAVDSLLKTIISATIATMITAGTTMHCAADFVLQVTRI
jgi:hypothetical protein